MWYLAEAPALSAVACSPVPALTFLSGSSPPEKKPFEPLQRRECGYVYLNVYLSLSLYIGPEKPQWRVANYVYIFFIFSILALRIVGNFPHYDIVVRNWRHTHHTSIPELILKRDKASLHSRNGYESRSILVEPRFAY